MLSKRSIPFSSICFVHLSDSPCIRTRPDTESCEWYKLLEDRARTYTHAHHDRWGAMNIIRFVVCFPRVSNDVVDIVLTLQIIRNRSRSNDLRACDAMDAGVRAYARHTSWTSSILTSSGRRRIVIKFWGLNSCSF